jgi:hypothetical protein
MVEQLANALGHDILMNLDLRHSALRNTAGLGNPAAVAAE